MIPPRRWRSPAGASCWGPSLAIAAASLSSLAGGCDREPTPAGTTDPPADHCGEAGVICTWLGQPGLAWQSDPGLDRLKSGLYLVQDLAFAPDGTAYVADFNNHRVLQVALDGAVTLVAGNGVPGDGPRYGEPCTEGCPVDYAEIWHPSHVAIDPRDPTVVYAAAWHNHRLLRLDTDDRIVTWIAGIGEPLYADAPPALAYPSAAIPDGDGGLYIADQANQMVRQLHADGTITDLAGSPGLAGYSGDGGPGVDALLHGFEDWMGGPTSKFAVDGRALVLADTRNGVVRRLDLDTGMIERIAGKYVEGAEVGSVPGYSGDGGDALDAVFAGPRDVDVGPDGTVYIVDTGNHCVRAVSPAGVVYTVAGVCGVGGFDGDGGPATEALLDTPCGVAFDPDGALYVADSNNHVVRRIQAPWVSAP